MINDQAAALRQMKLEMEKEREKESPETFLATVPHPCNIMAISLIMPDEYESLFPPIIDWLPQAMNRKAKSCLWDQAGLAQNMVLNGKAGTLRYRMIETIESEKHSLSVRPAQNDFAQIIKDSANERVSFLKHIVHDLKQFSEVWISVKSSELKEYNSIIQCSDAVCIMVPPDHDSVLKCYEAVKNIKATGYSSPISLLEFSKTNSLNKQLLSDRIKNVAKNFLGLDLIGSGMVLSNITYEAPENYSCLGDKIASISAKERDFLYVLSESILYQIPGMI